MTAIELYRHEKALYEQRRAPIVAAALEQVRAAIARFEEANPHRGGRPKKEQTKTKPARRVGVRTASATHFRCGHERSPENTYTRKRKSTVHGDALKPNTECKTCAQARDQKKRLGEREISTAQRDRRDYDRQRYASNRDVMQARAREAYRRKSQRQEPTNA